MYKFVLVTPNKMELITRNGKKTNREFTVVSIPVTGCPTGEEENKENFLFEMTRVKDSSTARNLGDEYRDFSNKILPTSNGTLMKVTYVLRFVL